MASKTDFPRIACRAVALLLALALTPVPGSAQITEIIDSTGDGTITLSGANGIALDGSGNVYVLGGGSNNAFKIDAPGTCSTGGTPCTITEIIDGTGDGAGNVLVFPTDVAVDSSGNVYIIGNGTGSDNVFRITPAFAITEIMDATGDGTNALLGPQQRQVNPIRHRQR